MMELRHLRYFVAVAEELSYTKAAAKVHISPPPLLAQIKDLERDVGVRLLMREGHALKLTEAGQAFLGAARETLASARQSVALARQVANGQAGHLAIGYNTVAEFGVFPGIVRAFRQKWPDVQLSFHSRRTPQQLQALSQDDLEVGFVCPPINVDGLDIHELARQPFIAVLPSDHHLATQERVSFEMLSDEPLITPSRTLDPDAFRQIQQHFNRVGAVMNVVDELETATAIIRFVAMGNACSILPEYVQHILPEGVVCRPLDPAGIFRSLAIVKKQTKGGLAEVFYRFVLDSCLPSANAA